MEKEEVVIVVESRRLVCLAEPPTRDRVDMVNVAETQKLEYLHESPVEAGVVTSPVRGLIDVEVGNGIVDVPAGPCCAAALPATNAVVVVLCMLVVPVCRPAILVLGWVSFDPGGGMSYVDPGRVRVDGLWEGHSVAVSWQGKVVG